MLAYVNKDISSAVECAEGACRVHQMALHLSTQAFLFKEPVRADIRTHKQLPQLQSCTQHRKHTCMLQLTYLPAYTVNFTYIDTPVPHNMWDYKQMGL